MVSPLWPMEPSQNGSRRLYDLSYCSGRMLDLLAFDVVRNYEQSYRPLKVAGGQRLAREWKLKTWEELKGDVE